MSDIRMRVSEEDPTLFSLDCDYVESLEELKMLMGQLEVLGGLVMYVLVDEVGGIGVEFEDEIDEDLEAELRGTVQLCYEAAHS